MRENRQSGSEGGGAGNEPALPTPITSNGSRLVLDFILHSGDHVVAGSMVTQWTDFLNKSATYLPFIPFMSTLGEDDLGPGTGDDAYFNQLLAFPRNDYSDTEDFYSFDYGAVHVAVLSTETFNDNNYADQSAWLDDDLAWTDRIWKVVVVHKPPYSSGTHGSDSGHIVP